MKKYIYIAGAAALSSVLYGCAGDLDSLSEEGFGIINLKVDIKNDFTSALTSSSSVYKQQLEENCRINIYSEKGLIREYKGINAMPDTLHLMTGNYYLNVLAGDSVASSFTDKYYKGNKDFTVKKGSYIKETVVCSIQNVLATVNLEDGMDAIFEDNYSIKLYTAAGGDTLVFNKDNISQTAYFMPAQGVTQLGWAFTANVKSTGESYIKMV